MALCVFPSSAIHDDWPWFLPWTQGPPAFLDLEALASGCGHNDNDVFSQNEHHKVKLWNTTTGK